MFIGVPCGSLTRNQRNADSDPYFSSVVSLLHFDGTNGSTTFTDVKGNTSTVVGSPTISTAQSKFGGASLLTNATPSYLTQTHSGTLDYGSGAFTVEGWFYNSDTVSTNPKGIFWILHGSGQARLFLNPQPSPIPVFQTYKYNGTGIDVQIAGASNISSNAWHSFAAVKNGTLWTVYIDGASIGSGNETSASAPGTNSSGELRIGYLGPPAGRAWEGYLDEYRITKGIARYTGNYTPRSSAFPNG